jgi:hypothetical protein
MIKNPLQNMNSKDDLLAESGYSRATATATSRPTTVLLVMPLAELVGAGDGLGDGAGDASGTGSASTNSMALAPRPGKRDQHPCTGPSLTSCVISILHTLLICTDLYTTDLSIS